MNPVDLLRLEWRRYSRYPAFRVLAVLYAGSFALVIYLARAGGRNMTVTSNQVTTHPLAGLLVYPQNWTVLALIGGWMNVFLLGFLGVSMITMEFGNRTLRQSVIFGQTRFETAVSKLVWCVALAVAATGFYMLMALGGEALDGGGLPIMSCVVGFFLQALGYLLLGTLVGLVIRHTAPAVMAYLSYVLFLETVCRWIIYFTVAKTRALLFLPGHVLGALTPLPVPESVNHLLQSASRPLSLGEAELAALIYIAIFAFLFCRIIRSSDL